MKKGWTPDSWRSKPIEQVPVYPDLDALAAIEKRIAIVSAAGFCR